MLIYFAILTNPRSMKKRKSLQRIAFSVVISIICYSVIDLFIIEMPIWKYLVIEGMIAIGDLIITGFSKQIGYIQDEAIVEEIEE
jgi:hypothetical protein